MFSQTIALIQYHLLNYWHKSNGLVLLAILILGSLLAQFIGELSLVYSDEAQFTFLIEFYRYCLVFFIAIMIVVSISDDYATNQFEQLLSMPLSRWQYVLSQILALVILIAFVMLLVMVFLIFQFEASSVLLVVSSLFFELLLTSILALLLVISLEKIPASMVLFIAIYILARTSPVILLMLQQAVLYSDGLLLNKIVLMIFEVIQYVLPNSSAFLSSDATFESNIKIVALAQQAFHVILYSVFLVFIMLVDFYRKEFALNKTA